MNQLPMDQAAVLGAVDPDAYAAGTHVSGYISAANFHAIAGVILAGDLGVSGQVDAKFQQATDSSGTSAKDITGAAITALTGSGADGNKQAVIQLNTEKLDVKNGFTHVQLSITLSDEGVSPTGVASDLAGLVLGFNPRYSPASDNDASTVDEIVTA